MTEVSPELQGLTKFTVETRWEDLPPNVVQDTKMFLLDSIGCGLAGNATDGGKMIVALVKRLGGPAECSILGVSGKVACTNAVLANGQLINALDYESLTGHAAPYVVPAALAMAESVKASGQDLILATAIGLEVAARITSALPRNFSFPGPENALHWVTRTGYAHLNFGVAAAAGKLVKLDQSKLNDALGTAGHMSQVLTWIRDTYQEHRSMTKYGVPGWQNTGGVIAVLLAQMGFVGDKTLFEAKEGFWKFAGYDGWNPVGILDGIGTKWTFFNKILFKPYPCCRMFQTELDLFLKIISENSLRAEEISRVVVLGHPTLDQPAFTDKQLKSTVDIQFGPAYTFAMAANGVPRGCDWQDLELARSQAISGFAQKVEYRGYPEFGKQQKSIVEVTARGQVFRQEKLNSQLYEMTREDLIVKYRHNAFRALTQNKVEVSLSNLLNLEKITDLEELSSQIT